MTRVDAAFLRRNPLPGHAGAGSKEARGRVLVAGGCTSVPGAIRLAGEATLRAGAGKLQLATGRSVAPSLGLLVPEAMVLGCPETAEGGLSRDAAGMLAKAANQVAALALGPGMMADAEATALVAAVLSGLDGPAVVLDAGALHGLHDSPALLHRLGGRVVLTPHTGEMAGLLGIGRDEVEADKLRHARDVAARFGCVVVMKGTVTEIVSPSGEAWVHEGGTIGLATSGSGDVLTGLVAGLLARGTAPMLAASWAVYLHGEAGARLVHRDGGIGFLARELSAEVPSIMGALGGEMDA